MEISTFISYFVGTILIIIWSSLVINKKFFKKVLKDLEKNSFALYMSWLMGFFLGLFLVVNSQGFWTTQDTIITLLGYLITFKSIAILILPDVMIQISKKMKKAINYIRYFWILYIILGIALLILNY